MTRSRMLFRAELEPLGAIDPFALALRFPAPADRTIIYVSLIAECVKSVLGSTLIDQPFGSRIGTDEFETIYGRPPDLLALRYGAGVLELGVEGAFDVATEQADALDALARALRGIVAGQVTVALIANPVGVGVVVSATTTRGMLVVVDDGDRVCFGPSRRAPRT